MQAFPEALTPPPPPPPLGGGVGATLVAALRRCSSRTRRASRALASSRPAASLATDARARSRRAVARSWPRVTRPSTER
jgi:hypothetical protein